MLSGFKEVVIIALVLLALFLIPRFIRTGKAAGSNPIQPEGSGRKNTGMLRLGILLSLLWIALALILLNPVERGTLPFLGAGVFPVGLAWGLRWVVLGFRK